ncbi:MAG TPA: nucleotide exchange factor GrpE [Candidatus Babeliales bacterium]|nr:nucleotide exchange factor GrpE [Candidatus Babeliales bacterium]
MSTLNEEQNTVQLTEQEQELQQLRSALARVSADFENYKKRITKDQAAWRQNSQAEIFLELLVTIDSFDQAFTQYESGKNPELDNWITGFQMIHKNFHDLLKKFKITIIDENLPFNPEYHEAIAQVVADNKAVGEIVTVHQKGFMLGERVLRPATVTVAK